MNNNNNNHKNIITILVIEDNKADIQLIKLFLQKFKAPTDVIVISDGEKATDYITKEVAQGRAQSPDLIILDLNLPLKDGRDVLREIKTNPISSSIPVLVLTTSQNQDDILKCYQLHANCYLTKPSELSKFNHIMNRIEEFWLETSQLPKLKIAKTP